jgi:hypothetical protein
MLLPLRHFAPGKEKAGITPALVGVGECLEGDPQLNVYVRLVKR